MKAYCRLPFERLKIDANGTYQSCCQQTQFYGNIFKEETSIEKIYKGHLITEVKNATMTKSLHSICNNTRCPFYFTERERNIDVELTQYPKEIEIALPSEWCNIGGINPTPETACTMCPRSSTNFKNFQVPDRTDEIVEFIKPAIPHLKHLAILGVAEPFWKGRVYEVMDQLDYKKYKENIDFWTISNAEIFNPKSQNKFLDEYIHKGGVAFSIDAASKETYVKIRKMNMFETVKRNLKHYFEKVKDREHQWGMLLNNINLINLHEMEDMVRFAKEVGAPVVEFNLTYVSMEGMELKPYMLCNEKNWEQFWEGQQKAEAVAKEINQPITFYLPFHKGYLKE